MSSQPKEYIKLSEQESIPDYYTLDLLFVRMVNQLDDLRKHHYHCISIDLIDDAEQSMIRAFRTRELDDVQQFTADLNKISAQAKNSTNLSKAMGILMIGCIVLTLACLPVFLPSYLNIVTMPLWIDITVMSILSATTVIYLGCQTIRNHCMSASQFRFMSKQFDQIEEGLSSEKIGWQNMAKC